MKEREQAESEPGNFWSGHELLSHICSNSSKELHTCGRRQSCWCPECTERSRCDSRPAGYRSLKTTTVKILFRTSELWIFVLSLSGFFVWKQRLHCCVHSVVFGCLTSQQHACVSQGCICTDNFTCCRSNSLPHPVTVYWHWADQSQHWPYNGRQLAG